MNRYEHTETGWVIIVILGGFTVITALTAALAPSCEPKYVLYGVPVLLFAALLCFFKLKVTVDQASVRLRLGIGLVRVSVSLADIASAEAVKGRWYHGWGIRFLGDGWLYSVNSLDAVELKLKNGRRCRIGTNDPAGLLTAVRGAGVPRF
jgi:hypothetical protein